VQLQFWEQVRIGVAAKPAARAAGIAPGTGARLFRQAGGVIGNAPRRLSPARLSMAEREEIACLKAAGHGPRAIGRTIGRSASTVSRELARNTGLSGSYRASSAQHAAEERAKRPKTAKLRADPVLRDLVQDGLDRKWSPRQISQRLVLEFPDRPEMRVSHETIYQALYVQGRGALRRELTCALRTGRALRMPRRQAQARRARPSGGIQDMVNIGERPAEVADRAVPGHWEGDLILGKDNKSAIGTLVERRTRFVMLLHLPDGREAATVAAAMIEVIQTLPPLLLGSLAWDQGKEMAQQGRCRTQRTSPRDPRLADTSRGPHSSTVGSTNTRCCNHRVNPPTLRAFRALDVPFTDLHHRLARFADLAQQSIRVPGPAERTRTRDCCHCWPGWPPARTASTIATCCAAGRRTGCSPGYGHPRHWGRSRAGSTSATPPPWSRRPRKS
jgi:IS30 family transposase